MTSSIASPPRVSVCTSWFKAHPYLHNAIGVPVLIFLFAVDYWALLQLPRLFLPEGQPHSAWMILLAGTRRRQHP